MGLIHVKYGPDTRVQTSSRGRGRSYTLSEKLSSRGVDYREFRRPHVDVDVLTHFQRSYHPEGLIRESSDVLTWTWTWKFREWSSGSSAVLILSTRFNITTIIPKCS
ncbi:hypothetical protein AVEN_61060-1 [Araneus ventricosus]|uniref:Uncharacterized protein n=1 Tax=Araneus ventricosus TaxID=182803 RepID=A0A4Y2DUF9_ARAVE|nr:hypothetical protein AVEN_61060-1 [Araneus ventricosus]